MHYAFKNPPRRIRRLRYRSGPESLTFLYDYPERKWTENEPVSFVEKKSKVSWIHELEGMLDEMKNDEDNDDERNASRFAGTDWASTSLHDENKDLTRAGSSEEKSIAAHSGPAAGQSDGAEMEREREANARPIQPDLTWAGSMPKGSTVEETVAAAGHPDAAEVMQSQTSTGPASAERPPEVKQYEEYLSGMSPGVAPHDAHVNSGIDKGKTISQDPFEQDLSPIGRLAESTTAEDVTAAAGHSDDILEMRTDKRQSSEPIRMTAPSLQHEDPSPQDVDIPVAFTAEIAVVKEVDVMLPDRSVFRLSSTYPTPDILRRPVDFRLVCQAATTVPSEEVSESITTFFDSLIESSRDPQAWPAESLHAPETVNLTSSDKSWKLELDEDLQVSESRPAGQAVVLRSVKVIDKVLAADRSICYTEVS